MADVIGFDPVAYSIDGGRHPGLLLRTAQYAATNGTEGIVSAADCRVHQLATPGRGVAIDPGAILIRNASGTARNQTYVANASTLTTLDTPAATSTARSYVVLVRIEDPEFGWPNPATPLTHQYTRPIIHGPVPANTTHAKQLNLGYSAYMLARIDIPANTTTITDAMIKNQRKLAQPGQWEETFTFQPPAGTQQGIDANFSRWPEWEPQFDVPEWASQVTATMNATGIYKPVGGLIVGDIQIEFCVPGQAGPPLGGGYVVFEEDNNDRPRRVPLQVSGTSYVDGRTAGIADARGLRRSIRIGARRNATFSEAGSNLIVNERSNFIVTVRFREVPT